MPVGAKLSPEMPTGPGRCHRLEKGSKREQGEEQGLRQQGEGLLFTRRQPLSASGIVTVQGFDSSLLDLLTLEKAWKSSFPPSRPPHSRKL